MNEKRTRSGSPHDSRRRFLRAVGVAGIAGVAGCLDGDGGNGNGDGGDGGGDTGGGNGDGSANGDGGPRVPEADRPFLLPAGRAETTFDAELTPETVLVEGDALDAVVEADRTDHRYTFDADRLETAGLSVEEGSVLLLSGLALRRVSSVERQGSSVVVDTEFASLNEAISDGTVGWDADLGFDPGMIAYEGGDGGDGGGETGSFLPEGSAMLAGVAITDAAGAVTELPPLRTVGNGVSWSFTQGQNEYTFELTPSRTETKITVEIKRFADGKANLRYTGVGTIQSVRSTAAATFAGGTLDSMDFQARNLAGEMKIDIAAAGSGFGDVDFEFPGLMFKYLIMAGPVPVTVGITTKMVASIKVPVGASSTASSTFRFGGDAGFEYAGTTVTPKASLGTMQFDPESPDAAGNIGSPVDAQFGVAFPRLSVSVFDQGIVPYLHTGAVVGSSLTWGPVCKSGYVKFLVEAGYDFKILGVSLSSGKETLYEDERTAKGDNCAD